VTRPQRAFLALINGTSWGQPYFAQNETQYEFTLKTLNTFFSIFTNAHLTGCSTEAFIYN